MSFYRDTIRKAKKQHRCGLCGAIIEAGELYHDKCSTCFEDDSSIYYDKECNKCQPLISEYLVDADMGYNAEYMREWWMNEKCRVCSIRDDEETEDCEMTHYCRCENWSVRNEMP